ncbi:MAG: hypothetical protein IJF74_05435 [Clostridia bacterium]|nr:hypothetical protein [Clostridia bacterium]
MKKRIIALLMLAVMLVLCACTGKPPATTDDGTKPAPGTQSGDKTTDPVVTTAAPVTTAHADIPDGIDYGDSDFVIYCTGNLEWHDFESIEDDMTVIGEATYRRNMIIEDRLGVKIIEDDDYLWGDSYGSGTGYKRLERSYSSNSPVCDFAMIGTHDVANAALHGFIRDLTSVEHIDLSKVYWDQQACADLRIGNKLPFTSVSFSTIVDAHTFCIFFNKELAKEQGLPNLYDLVNEGKWTVDKFNEFCAQTYVDLNGNDSADRGDQYGAIVWNDTVLGVINSCGEAIGTVVDGKLELTLYNDTVLAMIDKYVQTAYSDNVFNYQSAPVGEWQAVLKGIFGEERSLFNLTNVHATRHYRESAVDFGIIPYFKLDENQENYSSHIQEGGVQFFCIPQFVENIEMTAIVAEVMAAESYNIIRPAFFEKHLVGTIIRDEESESTLDLVFESQLYDVGAFYRIGGYTTDFFRWFQAKETNLSSFYEERKEAALTTLKEINDQIAELD